MPPVKQRGLESKANCVNFFFFKSGISSLEEERDREGVKYY